MPVLVGIVVGIFFAIWLFGLDISQNGKNNVPAPPQINFDSGPSLGDAFVPEPKLEKPTPPPKRTARGNETDAIWKLYFEGGTGSAFVVGRSEDGRTVYLITSAHCVKDEKATYMLGGGHFGEDVRFHGVKVLVRDVKNDVALLEAPMLSPYHEIQVNQWSSGVEGLAVSMAGYGNGVWSEHETTLTEIKRLDEKVLGVEGSTPQIWSTADIAEPGHSGSPVWDQDGRLVGVLCAGNAATSEIIHCRYVRWLLESYGQEGLIDRRVPREEDTTDKVPEEVAQN